MRANGMKAPGGGVLIIIEDNRPNTTDRDSAPAWRGTDLEDRLLGGDIQFVQDIVEQQLGGVIRMLYPRVHNSLPGGGGTYTEIWLPAVANLEEFMVIEE